MQGKFLLDIYLYMYMCVYIISGISTEGGGEEEEEEVTFGLPSWRNSLSA